jgi:hypothetical protein
MKSMCGDLVKIFMRFLNIKVLLTKLNPLKGIGMDVKMLLLWFWGRWRASIFKCPFALIVWPTVYMPYNISWPTNIINMLENWLKGTDKKFNARICIGASALCWSLWRCRNNIVFNNIVSSSVFLGFLYGFPLDISMIFFFSRRISVHCISGYAGWRHTSKLHNGLMW